MDLIYAKRSKVFEQELETAAAQGFGATTDPIKEIVENDTIENKEESEEDRQKTEDKTESLDPKTQHSKRVVLIEGRPIEFTEEEYARLAEKGLYQPQVQAVQQQFQQPITPPQKADDPKQNHQNDLLRDIARRITYGSEDESIGAIADLINAASTRTSQNQADPNQIAQFAAQQALAQLQFQKNLETIASEYKDIYEKRSATLVAADYVNSLRYKYGMLGIAKPDLELWREACEKTREDLGISPKTTTAKDQNKITAHGFELSNKLERKRAAPKPPAAATRVIAMEQQRAITGSDIVAAMRKSRGQAVA